MSGSQAGGHYDAERLYSLLPAIYRVRDAEQGYPLRDLVALLAREADLLDADQRQLYADAFIETCAEWAVPYLGDLLGVRPLPALPASRFSRRAEVANTLHYRRGKGTARVLEALAADVTGWPAAVAVEHFERLATTQYLNHLRPANRALVDLGDAAALERLGGPFETASHTLEARRAVPRRGRYNIPEVALHLWRLDAEPLILGVARPHGGTGRQFTVSPLGHDLPLFVRPAPLTSREARTREHDVPQPLRRRVLHGDLSQPLESAMPRFYGRDHSVAIFDRVIDGEWQEVDRDRVVAANLADWDRPVPAGRVALDPVTGRIVFDEGALPPGGLPPDGPRVLFHRGTVDDLGGGTYDRSATFTEIAGQQTFTVTFDPEGDALGDALGDAIDDALAALAGAARAAVVVIEDSATHSLDLGGAVVVPAGRRLEIRAADGQRPLLLLGRDLEIDGGEDSAFELSGVVVAGADATVGAVRVEGAVERVVVQHTTLVPGRGYDESGAPLAPGADSLVVASDTATVHIAHSIVGTVRSDRGAELTIEDSVLDALDRTRPAYLGLEDGDSSTGGTLTLRRATVVGTLAARAMPMGENVIFLGIVTIEHRQTGCVRYSFVRPGSRVPRRHRCQPVVPAGSTASEAARITARVEPCFTSLDPRHPAYAQLEWRGPRAIARGADDASEMGVFNRLRQPQREDGLRMRLDEYLPVELEAGIFYTG